MLGPGSGPRRWPADHPRERRREPRTGRPAYPHWGHGQGPGRFLAARRGVGRVGVADETRSPTPMKITFLLHNAYAIDGTVRSTLNLAGALAARHEVEIVSVLRTAERPLLGVHGDVRLVPLVDERPDSAAYDGGHELMARPSALVPPTEGTCSYGPPPTPNRSVSDGCSATSWTARTPTSTRRSRCRRGRAPPCGPATSSPSPTTSPCACPDRSEPPPRRVYSWSISRVSMAVRAISRPCSVKCPLPG